jgi:hypothetical protein
MIVQDYKPGNGHREDFRKFLEPMFDPAFSGRASLPRAGRPTAHSASHSDTSKSRQDQPDAHAQSSWRHGRISWNDPDNLPNPTR